MHARRHETEIMRLVGAPELTIPLPLLLQGMVQGLLGARPVSGNIRAFGGSNGVMFRQD